MGPPPFSSVAGVPSGLPEVRCPGREVASENPLRSACGKTSADLAPPICSCCPPCARPRSSAAEPEDPAPGAPSRLKPAKAAANALPASCSPAATSAAVPVLSAGRPVRGVPPVTLDGELRSRGLASRRAAGGADFCALSDFTLVCSGGGLRSRGGLPCTRRRGDSVAEPPGTRERSESGAPSLGLADLRNAITSSSSTVNGAAGKDRTQERSGPDGLTPSGLRDVLVATALPGLGSKFSLADLWLAGLRGPAASRPAR